MRPTPTEYFHEYERYISLVPDANIVDVLAEQRPALRTSLGSLPDDRAGFRYAPGKWTVRETVGHLIDAERVFGYRALWFARGDVQPLPGFDQDPFAATAHHDRFPIGELVDELCALRESHVLMFRHLDADAWKRHGAASGHPMSTRAAAFIMAGHVLYHAALLRDRYGIPVAPQLGGGLR
jgi:DinB superfamily